MATGANATESPDIRGYLRDELIRGGLAEHEADRLLDIAASYGDQLKAEREARRAH